MHSWKLDKIAFHNIDENTRTSDWYWYFIEFWFNVFVKKYTRKYSDSDALQFAQCKNRDLLVNNPPSRSDCDILFSLFPPLRPRHHLQFHGFLRSLLNTATVVHVLSPIPEGNIREPGRRPYLLIVEKRIFSERTRSCGVFKSKFRTARWEKNKEQNDNAISLGKKMNYN